MKQNKQDRLGADALKAALVTRAADEGFALCRVTKARLDRRHGRGLIRFLREGREGDMGWLRGKAGRRRSPHALWSEAKSAIVLGLAYHDGSEVELARGRADQGVISVYAQGADYHDLIKKKLKRLGRWLVEQSGQPIKVFVDTAPVMEKPLAAASGLGWQGKHTNLVSREQGSWFFLGVILCATELPEDEPESDHCGSCRACMDACPSGAITAPYQIDARACISYLTIEHKGPIPMALRKAMGNRVYGCDDCLAACPWNKFAVAGREAKLAARLEARDPGLDELLALGEEGFRVRFQGSPIKRIGWERFLRNLLIAAGNSGETRFLPRLEGFRNSAKDQAALESTPPQGPDMIFEAASWAITEIRAAARKRGPRAFLS